MHNLHKLDPTTEPKKKLQHDLKVIPVFNGMNFISLSLGGPTKFCEQICGGFRLRSSFCDKTQPLLKNKCMPK